MNKLAILLDYAARGCKIFPLAACSKEPLAGTHGLKEATTDEAQIRAWHRAHLDANWAWLMGDGLITLDIDKRHGGDVWYEANKDRLPETVTGITGGDGLHLVLRVEPDTRIKNDTTGKIAPGVDVKSAGGYIVIHPSYHPNRTQYRWQARRAPHDLEPALCPDWIVEKIADKEVGSRPVTEWSAPASDDRVPADVLLERGLRQANVGSRDDTGFKLARQVWANGYDGIEGEAIMYEYARRVPQVAGNPYTEADALRNWNSAHNYARLAPWTKREIGGGHIAPEPEPATGEDLPGIDTATGEVVNVLALLAFARRMRDERDQAIARAEAAEHKASEADRTARYMREASRIPNVLPGVKATLAPLVWQYQQKVSACQADDDGWVHISLSGLAESTSAVPLNDKERRYKAEQAGDYLKDMVTLGWIERRPGKPTVVNGHPVTQIFIRPKHEALLTSPASLPYPSEKRPRPVKATCPRCKSVNTKQIIMCLCDDCGHVFDKPADPTLPAAPPTPAPEPTVRKFSDHTLRTLYTDRKISVQGSEAPAGANAINDGSALAAIDPLFDEPYTAPKPKTCPTCGGKPGVCGWPRISCGNIAFIPPLAAVLQEART